MMNPVITAGEYIRIVQGNSTFLTLKTLQAALDKSRYAQNEDLITEVEKLKLALSGELTFLADLMKRLPEDTLKSGLQTVQGGGQEAAQALLEKASSKGGVSALFQERIDSSIASQGFFLSSECKWGIAGVGFGAAAITLGMMEDSAVACFAGGLALGAGGAAVVDGCF